MKSKSKLLIIVLLFCHTKLFSQEKQSLNFILLINDNVPEYGIFTGEFQINDSTGKNRFLLKTRCFYPS